MNEEPTGFTKLPPIEGGPAQCNICNCGAHDTLDLEALLAVGFGDCSVTKDGSAVWSEVQADCEQRDSTQEVKYWQCKDAEAEAAKDPNHDWQIQFFAPLYEATYQRQGANHWVLVAKGMGFA